MAVEKLLRPKFAKIKFRYDALQPTFLIFETFCIPEILAVWEETGVFQQPQAISLRIPVPGILSVMAMFRQSRHRIPGMTYLRVDIVGFADESFPGFVHCDFTDAIGKRHTFLEKIPVVTTQNLWSDSTYPQPGMMPCETVECLHDGEGRALARVCINAMDPTHPAQFIVLESQLENDR